MSTPIIDIRHPYYSSQALNWRKWRLTYEGGDRFIHAYLKKLSKREDNKDFHERRAVTYCPAFAKAALNDVKNAIYQRTTDVSRSGGSDTYQSAVEGVNNGVDLLGSSMNAFMGRKILPELLSMARVGIYVDMPQLDGPTKLDAKGKRPYLYWYPAESILSWCTDDTEQPNEFTNVLLMDSMIDYSDHQLPIGLVSRYRHVYIGEDGYVWVQFYDHDGCKCNKDGLKNNSEYESPVRLNIKRIPFVLLEISDSLLTDVANYQIALLNLASSDMAFSLKANFPFYVEQFDPRTTNPYGKGEAGNSLIKTATNPQCSPDGTITVVATSETVKEVQVGIASGRKYPLGANQPAFINPSSEPMTASMAKQEQLKAEIRQLINLAISNLQPTKTSGEARSYDNQGLENGLSYIGLELEHAERKIADFWAMYEGSKPATVAYPENYSLISDEDRRKAATDLEGLLPKLPSKTYQKAIAKRIAITLLGGKVSNDELKKILKEIDSASVINTDPDVIQTDFEAGFVGLDLASEARGYPKGEVEKAKKDHADRIARIAQSQAQGGGMGSLANPDARGVTDLSGNPQGGSQEKTVSRDTTMNDTPKDRTRGEGQ